MVDARVAKDAAVVITLVTIVVQEHVKGHA